MVVKPRMATNFVRLRDMAGAGSNRLVVAALLVCWIGCLLQPASAATASEIQALLAVRKLDKNQKLTWNEGDDPCASQWVGITCSGSAITVLSLMDMNLTGVIPPAIGDLVNLKSLEMSRNPRLTGPLPAELGKLKELTALSIQQCSITGSIPEELGKLRNLSFLALNGNQLTGPIPYELGNLENVYWFDISLNQISGSLPVSTDENVLTGIDKMRKIKHFHFNDNLMTGEIPREMFDPPALIHLLLDHNRFSGSLPANITSRDHELLIMKLDHNRLSGDIPPWVGNFSKLTELHLNDNSFARGGGVTMPDLSVLSGTLKLLDLSMIPFVPDVIPPSWQEMRAVQTLSCSECNLKGELPGVFLEKLPALSTLELSGNNLESVGHVEELGKSLKIIDLENNQIEEFEIPADTESGVLSKGLFLSGNLPLCAQLEIENIKKYCEDRKAMYLRSYEASCGRQVDRCGEQSQHVNFATNCVCGYPLTFSMRLNAPPFRLIDQETVDQLRVAIADMFTTQRFQGENPGQSLPVILSSAQVSIVKANFTADDRLEFTLDIFPPREKWTEEEFEFIKTFFILNLVHLPANQGPYSFNGTLSAPFALSTESSSLGTGAIAGIIGGAVVVLLIVGLIALYAIRQKRRADRAEIITRPFASWGTGAGTDNGAAPVLKGARWFSVSELKKATNNFSENNEVGSGGYGKVYKGVLPSGDVVAIKRAQEGSMQGATEFKNEIELLSRVHHRNLVGLIGFCYEQGEQMLVYEFMTNGTLRDHLLARSGRPLTWQNRLNIALGSAKGLSYLHELANPPIIHRDIKSTNILLDERMTAKVADFGLSKLAPDDGAGKAHVSTQVKGTLGYLDPEYYMTQQLSEKSDVYSFGVVLLEILTARAPIERGKYIVREIRTALDKGGIAAGLPPLLDHHMSDYPPSELEDFLTLALQCVEEVAADRPNMSQVVQQLEKIGGNSFTGSETGGRSDARTKDVYNDTDFLGRETQFQYSGGFTPNAIEPK